MDELERLEARWERARAWVIGQSFGPWAYHGCAGSPPFPFDDPDFAERLCEECRATYNLAVEFADELEADR